MKRSLPLVFQASNVIIDLHGRRDLQALLSIFESPLRNKVLATDTADYIAEGVIILFGRLARHLDPEDEKVRTVIDNLIDALNTPSEAVQIAVSECLPPLIKSSKDLAPRLIETLLQRCLHGEKYAHRRGAAYGLAGAVKGRGTSSLKEFNVINRLKSAMDDKKDSHARQGAIFAIETLANGLGRIFEPYIIQLLSSLLITYGDSALEVRNATQDASRVIMSKISGHAVKLILPTLLAGLDDRRKSFITSESDMTYETTVEWRSKKGAVELLVGQSRTDLIVG